MNVSWKISLNIFRKVLATFQSFLSKITKLNKHQHSTKNLIYAIIVASDPDKLSMIEAVAQSVIFFAAGQETTSSAISCCLYELSLNPDVQEQLQEEIDQVFDSVDGMTFEKLFEMKYLDMVFCGKSLINLILYFILLPQCININI